jgi:hypothetical protein
MCASLDLPYKFACNRLTAQQHGNLLMFRAIIISGTYILLPKIYNAYNYFEKSNDVKFN